MAEAYKREEVVKVPFNQVFDTIKRGTDWTLEYENNSGKEGELVYLTGAFSGAGLLALGSHGARKSLVFVKIKETSYGTSITVITGGTESWIGLDFGRHKKNVEWIFKLFEKGNAGNFRR